MVQVQKFGTSTNDLETLQQGSKRVQTKIQKAFGLSPTFVEVTGEKQVGRAFSPILNRVQAKTNSNFAVKFVERGKHSFSDEDVS